MVIEGKLDLGIIQLPPLSPSSLSKVFLQSAALVILLGRALRHVVVKVLESACLGFPLQYCSFLVK